MERCWNCGENATRLDNKQNRERMCIVTMWHVRVIIVAKETQQCIMYVLLRLMSFSATLHNNVV
jgi:hypothetical protein